MHYEKLSKNALYCMYTAGLVSGAVIFVILGAVCYFWLFPSDIIIGKWICLILAILTLFDILISPYFRYHRYRYNIDEECIDIKEGYLFIKRQIVPIERIHKLQTVYTGSRLLFLAVSIGYYNRQMDLLDSGYSDFVRYTDQSVFPLSSLPL